MSRIRLSRLVALLSVGLCSAQTLRPYYKDMYVQDIREYIAGLSSMQPDAVVVNFIRNMGSDRYYTKSLITNFESDMQILQFIQALEPVMTEVLDAIEDKSRIVYTDFEDKYSSDIVNIDDKPPQFWVDYVAGVQSELYPDSKAEIDSLQAIVRALSVARDREEAAAEAMRDEDTKGSMSPDEEQKQTTQPISPMTAGGASISIIAMGGMGGMGVLAYRRYRNRSAASRERAKTQSENMQSLREMHNQSSPAHPGYNARDGFPQQAESIDIQQYMSPSMNPQTMTVNMEETMQLFDNSRSPRDFL